MSTIRVRRSGLTALAVRLGSGLTGLVFVVLVTANVSSAEFGLWGLLSRTMGYVTGFTVIATFWATRYRARGIRITKTMLLLGGIMSVVLAPAFILISVPVAGTFPPVSQLGNLFYFMLSAPQVPLYIIVSVLEYVIIGYSPGRAYGGFALFEISKVLIGFAAIGVLRLSLTGAILSVMAAQVVQLAYLLFLQKAELAEKISYTIIRSITKASWLTLLNTFQGWLINFDYLVIAVLTFSTIPLAYYGSALAVAGTIGAASVLSAGLYPYILSGKDPTQSTNQTLELQAMFTVPAMIGAMVLSRDILHMLNPAYVAASPILYILSISMFFATIQGTFDNVVTGSDTVDLNENVGFSAYLRSKIFLMTKINLGLALAYLAGIFAIGFWLGPRSSGLIFGYNGYIGIGILWAVASLGMNCGIFFLKFAHARRIAKISVSRNLVGSLTVSSILYVVALFSISSSITPRGSTAVQALYILLMGAASLTVYFLSMLALSKSVRDIVRSMILMI